MVDGEIQIFIAFVDNLCSRGDGDNWIGANRFRLKIVDEAVVLDSRDWISFRVGYMLDFGWRVVEKEFVAGFKLCLDRYGLVEEIIVVLL